MNSLIVIDLSFASMYYQKYGHKKQYSFLPNWQK